MPPWPTTSSAQGSDWVKVETQGPVMPGGARNRLAEVKEKTTTEVPPDNQEEILTRISLLQREIENLKNQLPHSSQIE